MSRIIVPRRDLILPRRYRQQQGGYVVVDPYRHDAGGGGGGGLGPMPTFVASNGITGGVSTVNSSWPTHVAGDTAVLFVQSSNEAPGAISGCTQQAQLGTGTPGAAGSVMLTIYTRTAASSSEPTITVPDSGNHTLVMMMVLRGCDPSAPVDVVATASGATSATIALPSVTTTGPERLVVHAVADSLDQGSRASYFSWANAGLASVTERLDGAGSSGTGGGIAAATGERAVAGATGAGSVTYASAAANYVAITLAFKSP